MIFLILILRQVEQRRLGIPRDVPVAVQQWDGLIAVNYAARECGITRHMRSAEAKAKCPDLVLVHVETIGQFNGGLCDSTALGLEKNDNPHSRLTQKACLARYRRASGEILALLHRLLPATSTIEKASIDEVYVDVTNQVEEELEHTLKTGTTEDSVSAFPWGAIVLEGPLESGSEFDVRLATGAGIACRIRGALLEELGFTASAGISFNKVLAKIGSGLNKPNQMTVIPIRAVGALMASLPLRKIPGFGGKVGDALQALGCTTAGDVEALSMGALSELFGPEKAQSIVNAVQGKTMDKVQARERPKSMLAAKSFSATSDMNDLRQWIEILSGELAARMLEDEELFNRRAKTLVVHFKSVAQRKTGSAGLAASDHSKRGPMPRIGHQVQPSSDALVLDAGKQVIATAAWNLFKNKCLPDAIPCCRLALSAVDFEDGNSGGRGAISEKGSITNFLRPQNKPQNSENSPNRDDGKTVVIPSDVDVDKLLKNQPTLHVTPMKRKTSVVEEEEGAAMLPDVDIEEQRRLLKEASMLHTLNNRKPKENSTKEKKTSTKNQQMNISQFFTKS